ncbi:MAG: class I SAM-dependent DNA methyltransferase [Rhodoferax sp.]|nr:class I SAM-dependent DNA methyltransferase [Rhodoferax sp.]
MTPQEFIKKWGPGGPAFDLNERQGAQPHFIDLCQLLEVPLPGSVGDYIFEQDTLVLGEARGYADVFYRNHFAWENKAPGRNLDTALKQLLTYSLALSNPPLLVVCDRLTTRIHTQFNGHPSEVHTVLLHELDQPEKRALLRRLWLDPESFRPKKTSRDITEAAAKSFATLAEGLRKRGTDADEVAHFLTQCLFCFFAEDVGLLPGNMFEALVNNKHLTSDKLTQGLTNLFTVMRKGGLYGNDDIPWFNGGLFKKVKVPLLSIMEVTELRNAAALNWSAIDVSIFGTLFERGLDPAKRSQLGAHYTDPATIMRIVEPVLCRPLLQKWELVAQELRALMAKSTKRNDKHHKAALASFVRWLELLKDYRVLDPACGSGNFLFLGLKALKDIEHQSHLDAVAAGLDRQADLVTGPHNVLGIELNEYAAELARVTVWIGELQWRADHGYEFKTNPVLEPLDHIECRDALLSFGGTGSQVRALGGTGSGAQAGQTPGAHEPSVPKSPPTSAPPTPRNLMGQGDAGAAPAPAIAAATALSGVAALSAVEAAWPKASVVIGNPPFLGDKKMRSELGDDYTTTLRKVYEGRVPGGADLVCYWFEKARKAIETNRLGAAGLVATNSIRGGKNRKVLEAICETTRIYEAWSDEGWVNEGAAVRVSLVAFGHASQDVMLDGATVAGIHSDLSISCDSNIADTTMARKLESNKGVSFQGAVLIGDFEVERRVAEEWLKAPNPHGQSNCQVLRPISNGKDLNSRSRGLWVVDFNRLNKLDASLFEKPFEYVVQHVKPIRATNPRPARRDIWWQHGEHGGGWRSAVKNSFRFIATSQVSKHRFFIWLPTQVWPHQTVIAFARADDTTFGILHSRFHEIWSLRMGTSLEDRPRYTPTTCFETFPFPQGLTPADTAHQRTETVDGGALIPAESSEQNMLLAHAERAQAAIKIEAKTQLKTEVRAVNLPPTSSHPHCDPEGGWAAKGSAQVKEETAQRAGDTEQGPLPPSHPQRASTIGAMQAAPTSQAVRNNAIAIATAAKRLNDLRENWLNPPEWTMRVPEVTPLGMDHSPYPDRILPKPGFEKDLAERTLTKLYNQRPAWLDSAHKALDKAVANAYGWTDYTPDMPDDEILKRLLALNLQRSAISATTPDTAPPAMVKNNRP